MNTIHDENKIKSSIEHTAKLVPQSQRYLFIYELEKIMKEYAQYIREKTIDECIACVPQHRHVTVELADGDIIDIYTRSEAEPFNTCREQTITNLNNLKNNEPK